MTGHDRAEVLNAAISLDDREGQIAENGNDGIEEADQNQYAVINGGAAIDQVEDTADQQSG